MMINKRFHRLLVVDDTARAGANVLCRCVCDCGTETLVLASNLRRGATKSCGCWKKETAGRHVITHGKSHTAEYAIWAGVVKRCYNPKHRDFHVWGGKGITVCAKWRNDFDAFFNDMGPRPSPKHSIDRIDGAKNYEKGNCRWATPVEQSLNTNRVRKVAFNGETMSMRSFAAEIGRSYFTVYDWMVRRGRSVDEVLALVAR